MSEAAHVKFVKLAFLVGMKSSVLAIIQEGAQHPSSVDHDLVCSVSSLFVHTLFESLEIVVPALPVVLFSSLSSERVSVIVEPRYVKS